MSATFPFVEIEIYVTIPVSSFVSEWKDQICDSPPVDPGRASGSAILHHKSIRSHLQIFCRKYHALDSTLPKPTILPKNCSVKQRGSRDSAIYLSGVEPKAILPTPPIVTGPEKAACCAFCILKLWQDTKKMIWTCLCNQIEWTFAWRCRLESHREGMITRCSTISSAIPVECHSAWPVELRLTEPTRRSQSFECIHRMIPNYHGLRCCQCTCIRSTHTIRFDCDRPQSK